MLEKVKLALRISTNAYDTEISALIQAALLDLKIAGLLATVVTTSSADDLVFVAVATYVKLHFGNPEKPELLKQMYDEMKGQLQIATGYADWGEEPNG